MLYFQNTVSSVLFIIEERMTGISQCDPYLMCPPRLKTTFDECYISERFNNFVMCHSILTLAAVREDLHYLAVPDIAAHMPVIVPSSGSGVPHTSATYFVQWSVEELLSSR